MASIEARRASRLAKSRSAVRPLQYLYRFESVALDALDDLVGKGIDLAGFAKRAVAHMPTRAASDLAELGGGQLPVLMPIELAVLREGDMVDIQVQAHADGVGSHQKIDVARLVELDLGIARARAESPQNHCGTAALAPDQLGDGIDLVGGEGDDGGAPRQPRDLLLAGMGQMRHARAGDDGKAAQQPLQNAAHRAGAQEQGFLPAAQMQDAVGEDVPPLHVGSQLHLVDCHEGSIGLARHGFDRADGIARPGRGDLLLAGDEGHIGRADLLRDAAIDPRAPEGATAGR